MLDKRYPKTQCLIFESHFVSVNRAIPNIITNKYVLELQPVPEMTEAVVRLNIIMLTEKMV